jgi:cell division transport system permease protein
MIHFLAFSVRRAFEGFRRNAVMSLAATVTMVLMLGLLASLVIVLSGMQAGLRFVEEKVEIQAFLNDGVTRDQVAALEAEIAALPEVASVTFTSKEQALEEFRAQLAAEGREDLTTVTGTNPIPAKLSVKLRDPRDFGDVVETLESAPGLVSEVIEQQKNVDRLVEVTSLLRTVGAVILGIVGVTVLLIVVNTIRMAVMSRADEIEIMRLVGASDAFIRWPFIFEGIFVGLVGALVTLGLLALASAPISSLANAIAGQVPVGFSEQLASQVASLVVATGVGLGGLGAFISVRTYLRRS